MSWSLINALFGGTGANNDRVLSQEEIVQGVLDSTQTKIRVDVSGSAPPAGGPTLGNQQSAVSDLSVIAGESEAIANYTQEVSSAIGTTQDAPASAWDTTANTLIALAKGIGGLLAAIKGYFTAAGSPSSSAVLTVQGNLAGTALPAVGQTQTVAFSPAVTAALYTIGYCFGTVVSLANIMLGNGFSALLHHISLTYGAAAGTPGNPPAGFILFFNVDPTSLGTVADHGAFAWGTSVGNLVGVLRVNTSDWQGPVNGVYLATYTAAGMLMKSSASTGLWALFVLDSTSGVPTPTATGVFTGKMKFIPQAN
jgi:hypothetical protein